MWATIEHLTTSSRIAYDKTVDVMSYYAGYSSEKLDDNDFSEMYEFENTNNNSRIYPTIPYSEAYKAFRNEPTLIIDNIYLGSAYNAASYNTLKNLEINVIMNATTEIRNYFPEEFTYYKYSLYDNNKNSIYKYLDESFKTIRHHQDNTDGNILIHCFMGASRSVSIVMNYIMNTKVNNDGSKYTYEEALQYIKNVRPIINPTHRLISEIIKNNKGEI